LSSDKKAYEILSLNQFTGFAKDIIAHEQSKAALICRNPSLQSRVHQLEDHPQLLGNLSNFKLDSKNIEHKIDAFLEIWSDNQRDSSIIRAFLTIGDYSVKTHDYSTLGKIRFFGCKNHWNRVLTTSEKTERAIVSNKLDEFLIAYCQASGTKAQEKLASLIDGFVSDTKDWRYYFIRYSAICGNKFRNLNVYAWSENADFQINHLGNSGKQPLHSYHYNPYIIALKYLFINDTRVGLKPGRFSDLSWLNVNGKLNLSCVEKGWLLSSVDDFAIDPSVVQKYNLVSEGDDFLLEVLSSENRIDIANELIDELIID